MPVSGHPVTELVRELREAAGPAGQYVHFGATAQDVMDTALVMRLSRVLAAFDRRLQDLVAILADHADRHRNTVMAGRTRTQQGPCPSRSGSRRLAGCCRWRVTAFDLPNSGPEQ